MHLSFITLQTSISNDEHLEVVQTGNAILEQRAFPTEHVYKDMLQLCFDCGRLLSCGLLPRQIQMHQLQPCLPTQHLKKLQLWQLRRCYRRSLVRLLDQAMQTMPLENAAPQVLTGKGAPSKTLSV